MGDTVSKLASTNSCMNQDEKAIIPRFHFKCRYHEDDKECITGIYTRTKDIKAILIFKFIINRYVQILIN